MRPARLYSMLATGLLALCLCGPVAAAQRLVFAATSSPAGNAIAGAVLAAAYAQLGIEIELVALPVRRAYVQVHSGQFDGISASGVLQIEGLLRLPVAVTYNEFMVYTAGLQFPVQGFGSLKPYSIGVVSGARYFEEALAGYRVDDAADVETLFRKLELGRTDVVIESRLSMCIAQRQGFRRVRMLEPPLERRLAYHYLHPRHRDLLPALERVLAAMEHDGRLKAIQDAAAARYLSRCN